ncbi:MAG: peptidoglycan recognition protein, partial [Actinomycetota bacterium]
MLRRRLFIVVLIAGLWGVLVPLPTPAASRFPATLDRSLELARGLRLNPTRHAGITITRPSRSLPIQANLVAFSFRTNSRDDEAVEDGVAITARFHTKSGWGAWEAMQVEPDESPDTASAEWRRAADRVFTAPIWVGTADAMMYRVSAKAGAPAVFDIRAHMVNSLGDAAKPNIFERLISAVSRFIHGGGGEAQAMTSTPAIISRKQWGANESWRECCPRYAPSVQMAFVHHTAGTNSYSKSQSAALVRSIYKFHTSNRGWSDIGYNFLVDRYGQIFEGRYGGMTKPVIGAHVKGFNTGSTGISLMGTFTSTTPSSAMQSALKRVLAWKLDVHHVPPAAKVT